MIDFDLTQLTRREKRALAAVRDGCGRRCVAEMFDTIVFCAAIGFRNGKTATEIREAIIGSFYDDVPLMRFGQAARNETLILAKVMVEQAIKVLCLLHH
jgi:hypothetical protein